VNVVIEYPAAAATTGSDLPADRRDSFRRDGFCLARGLIPTEELDLVLDEIRRVFVNAARSRGLDADGGRDMKGLGPLLGTLFSADQAAYLGAAKLAQHTTALHRLGVSERLVDAARSLGLGFPTVCTRPVLNIVSDLIHFEGGYNKTPPHQDWRSTQGSLDSLVAWIPFGDTDRANHPLEVMAGSHLKGLLPSAEHAFSHSVAPGVADRDEDYVQIETRYGDVLLFSTFLVHRTGAAGGPDLRMAASFRYNNADEPTFIARNYPNPYIYKPDMRKLDETFPTPQDVQRQFSE
jgi:hypothetical protein